MREALSSVGTLFFGLGLAGLVLVAASQAWPSLPGPTIDHSEQPNQALSAGIETESMVEARSLPEPTAVDAFPPRLEPSAEASPFDASPTNAVTREFDRSTPDALLAMASSDLSHVSRIGAVEAPPKPVPHLPITRVELQDIGIGAEVVVSRLVEVEGGVTWEVPAFKVGHAERTPGAGAQGNAILLGHVVSRAAGNVFEQLHRSQVGEDVLIYSDEHVFDYRVVEVRTVLRTDVSVLEPTNAASVTLITCTGRWLPDLHDYAERLVVRAELVSP